VDGVIPEMSNYEDFPYCLWYPEVPTEETCRKLVIKHPKLRYLVGRACAVAGYSKLYYELDLLPEVHIAEEARDNKHMDIFKAIMENNIKYSTMDDYTRTIFPDHPHLAYLNGDTAVRSTLEIKQEPNQPYLKSGFLGLNELPFDITEDLSVGTSQMKRPEIPEDVVALLYTPLPSDLPSIDKDIIILMAAYHGDIDRYARLRRPKMIKFELNCVVRGIYHQPMFANWWYVVEKTQNVRLRRACHARFIMSDDLSRITQETTELPTNIWYPDVASESIYAELIRRVPRMTQEVARACIIGRYDALWKLIDPAPTEPLLAEARDSAYPLFREDLEEKMAHMNDASIPRGADWEMYTTTQLRSQRYPELHKSLYTTLLSEDFMEIYNGVGVDAKRIELFALSDSTLKQQVHDSGKGGLELDMLYEKGLHIWQESRPE
jgi:hypothetical protein